MENRIDPAEAVSLLTGICGETRFSNGFCHRIPGIEFFASA